MFLTTGARHSEMIRAKLEDVDLAGRTLTIREKRRAKGTKAYRPCSAKGRLRSKTGVGVSEAQ
jgi:integrase